MENRINDILDTINDFCVYDDDMANKYISLIEEAIEVIDNLEAKPTSILDNAKTASVSELRNELANRMNKKSFFSAPLARKKSEFKISKALVTVAIGNVISSMQ